MAFPKISQQNKPLFQAALPVDSRVQARPMFGGFAAMVNGHMFAGLWADTVVVRLAAPDRAAVLAMEGAAEFDPMGRGKPMADMVLLPVAELDDEAALRAWLRKAMEHSATLPSKAVKPRSAAKASSGSKPAAKKPAAKKGTAKKGTAKKGTAKKGTVKTGTAKKPRTR